MLSLVDLSRVTGRRASPSAIAASSTTTSGGLPTPDRHERPLPPALSALALYQRPARAYRGIVDDTLRYLYDQALRTEDGASTT